MKPQWLWIDAVLEINISTKWKLKTMTNNFFVKAWRGEEQFWKVFLIFIPLIIAVIIAPFLLSSKVSFLIYVTIPFLLIIVVRCSKNMDSIQSATLNQSDNFIKRSWRGEEPFWIVLLIGVAGISFFVTLPFIWTHSVWPFALFVIFIPFFLLLITNAAKFIYNQNLHSDSFWRKAVVFIIHVSTFLLFVAYIAAILWVGTLSLIFHRP